MSYVEWTIFMGLALGVFVTLLGFIYLCERA